MPRPWPVEGVDASTPVRVAGPKIIGVRIAELAHYRERALARTNPEDLHDMRVATRRLRAALRLVGGPLARAAPGVKALGDALGRVRDVDVQIEWLEAERARVDDEERLGIDALLADRRAALPPLEHDLRDAVSRFQNHLEPALTIHLHSAGFERSLGSKVVRARVAKRLRAIGARIDELTNIADVTAVHALRIAGKKARYDLELVEGPYGAPASKALGRLKKLQEVIGELHDRDVHLALLPGWLAAAARPEQPGVVRLLRDALDERKKLALALDEELRTWREEGEAEKLAHALEGD